MSHFLSAAWQVASAEGGKKTSFPQPQELRWMWIPVNAAFKFCWRNCHCSKLPRGGKHLVVFNVNKPVLGLFICPRSCELVVICKRHVTRMFVFFLLLGENGKRATSCGEFINYSEHVYLSYSEETFHTTKKKMSSQLYVDILQLYLVVQSILQV